MAAKMMRSRIDSPPKTLSSLPVGGVGYISWTDVEIDRADLSTYVHTEAELYPEPDNETVRISRETDGFHLIIHYQGTKFEPIAIKDFMKLAPVVEIKEEIEPDSLDEMREKLQRLNRKAQKDSSEDAAS